VLNPTKTPRNSIYIEILKACKVAPAITSHSLQKIKIENKTSKQGFTFIDYQLQSGDTVIPLQTARHK